MGEQEIYRLSTDTLDEHFVESLREKYPHASLEIKVSVSPQSGGLSEKQFWSLMELLDWSKEGDSNAVIEPVVEALSKHPLRHIYEFQDILSEKLHRLDSRAHAENTGENAYVETDGNNSFFSTDEFLYARCCVVANGREAYEKVLQNPELMPKNLAFEALLRIARLAYQRKTGQHFRYVPAFNIETYGNREGWK
ncbi:MAG: DUF4240 domain-containing protein [Saprospiraceae bacterium]|nr:DUF4240 domain-containing protein [Saprospiraceae bacterium]